MSAGLSHEAVPVSKLEPGAVSCVAFNVRFGLPIQPIAATHSANFSAGE